MKQFKNIICLLLFALALPAMAQQTRSIKGTVLFENAEAVIGASVAVPGTNVGTTTDANGKFALLNVPAASKTVLISYLGHKSQIIDIVGKSEINVTLVSSVATDLNEVVIVGYGQQKKANLTGAVASVDTKVLEARPIADVGRGLQGITPGLSVVIPSGEIGSDPIMKIRGQFGSLRGGASPLILLDNVEIPSIQMINPDDIESISVLKDAASSSIYGAKAAFGVILITHCLIPYVI